MKRFKRISAIFLAMVLIVGLIPGGFLSVETSAESITPSVGDNKTWLHAVYDADGIVFDGVNDYTFPLDVALSSEIMIGAAWNLEYLYLAVNSGVELAKLQVNGKDVTEKSVTAAADADAGFAEYRISLLDAGISSIASGINTVTVQIGEETAQTLYLIFENNNYARKGIAVNPGATKIDTYAGQFTGGSGLVLYDGSSAKPLKGDLNTPAVVEVDLDIDQIFYNSSSSSNETNTLRTVCHGITVQVVDEYSNHNGKGINELF